jgi:RHS repeat-associated protein
LNLNDTRDALGNVTAENSTTYGYDGAERLTSSTPGALSWSYDQASQRTSAGPTTYAYDAAGELSSATKSSKVSKYAYDPEGDRTTATPATGAASTYIWNQAGELSSFTQGSTTVTYAYNADGLRMSKTGAAGKNPYIWDVAEGTPLLVGNALTNYVTGPGGLPLEQITGSKVTYYTHDQLGSTRLLTNSSGKSVGTYTYDPYGAVASHTGSVSTNLQFAGQFTDDESGLQYLQARYYDPATGQFMSVDPLATVTGQPYEYAGDDPVNSVDPSGNWSFALCFGACLGYDTSAGKSGFLKGIVYGSEVGASVSVGVGNYSGSVGVGVPVSVTDTYGQPPEIGLPLSQFQWQYGESPNDFQECPSIGLNKLGASFCLPPEHGEGGVSDPLANNEWRQQHGLQPAQLFDQNGTFSLDENFTIPTTNGPLGYLSPCGFESLPTVDPIG